MHIGDWVTILLWFTEGEMIQEKFKARLERWTWTRYQSQASTPVRAGRKTSVAVYVSPGDRAKGTIPHGGIVDLQLGVGSGVGHVIIVVVAIRIGRAAFGRFRPFRPA